ncbi:MAG: acyl-CoA desaturase [Bdellovibrionota bacterium]
MTIKLMNTQLDAHPETLNETQFNWGNTLFLSLTPFLAAGLLWTYVRHNGIAPSDILCFALMYLATGLSITVGYHRYYSHRAFECRRWVQFLFLVFGGAALQNSLLHWVSNHRFHHRHVDREADPYNIRKGFFWAHIGWMFFVSETQRPFANVKDLKRDPLVMWQERWYWALVASGFVIPFLIGLAFGRPFGGMLWGGLVRLVVVHHFTFFINSFAHTFGTKPHSQEQTARDSLLLALLSFGEGYHNFHHVYPSDYRNGTAWYHFDPSKWLIWTLEATGQASGLRRMQFIPTESFSLSAPKLETL